ncbi:hypothetical protein DFQ27_004114 [Actinomortierella ambigua]|uniref:Transcription elongation factor 1 homolog n=1 Tax=Actinomortierella ambigua TaxID=1343610 RepID=A0A9P6Q6W3_9FUNG|nr:hypothetical protein DFQ27_004114 [Actinomortierella ambigua]
MGKRKSSKRQPAKKMKKVLDTQFDCVSCFHEQSVSCKMPFTCSLSRLLVIMTKKLAIYNAACVVSHLSHAVDVYHDWIDACEAVNANAKAKTAALEDRDRVKERDQDRDRDRDRDDYESSSRRRKPYDRYDDDDDDDDY